MALQISGITVVDNSRNGIFTDVAANGGDITTTQPTFNLVNTTATTINFAGAATNINVGASTGTFTLNNQQTVFNSTDSIQIPSGTTAQRDGTPVAGQIRYNTTQSTFEGFGPGGSWGSLGGVRDVDQDTFIIPELSAGSNENTLYFNAGGIQVATLNATGFSINAGRSIDARAGTLLTDTVSTGATATPGTVTGQWTLQAGSTWQSTFADLAEWYVSDAAYEPGHIMIFGGTEEVTESTSINDRRVAGVISTNPAFIMNADTDAEFDVCIALQGRVPCKVVGTIEKGDLIATSSTPGHGIATNSANPYTIIGKAITEKTTAGPGLIEISVGR